eukprot:TRINITY_DN9946_c0_g2_i1.p1 TRINITY_DN9946_c0_g2~~TRINITY_DN9946_c0_g2_i1.p1  ORF type:complete len:1136 (+),score=385.87 TRINITY_DN9946_c0_g2_i1:197-3604(+)
MAEDAVAARVDSLEVSSVRESAESVPAAAARLAFVGSAETFDDGSSSDGSGPASAGSPQPLKTSSLRDQIRRSTHAGRERRHTVDFMQDLEGVGGNFGVVHRGTWKGALTDDNTGAARLANLRMFFESIDVDGNGSIEPHELATALQDLGAQCDVEDVEQLIEMIDRSSDLTMEFDEFVRFINLLERTPEAMAAQARTFEEVSPVVRVAMVLERATVQRITKAFRDQRERRVEGDLYTTGKQLQARNRLHSLLYDLPAWAPDWVWRRWWDVVILWAILFEVVTVSLAVVVASTEVTPGLLAAETFATCILVADVGVTLNTAIQDKGQFNLVTNRREIFRRYLQHQLFPDVVSAVPFDLVSWALFRNKKAWRCLRCLRLLKLSRCKSLFRMTDRGLMDETYVRFYFWIVPIMRMLWGLMFSFHCLTLGRILAAPKTAPDGGSCPSFGLDVCADDVGSRYWYAAWWVWALCLGQGLAAMETPGVHAYGTLIFLVALLLQSHVIARMSALLLKSDVKGHVTNSMREVAAMMAYYRVPEHLQQEVLSFNFHTLQQSAATSLSSTLRLLPSALQGQVGLFVRVNLVTSVPMFHGLSRECRLALANCLRQLFAEPEEVIIAFGDDGTDMYFIMHGFAEVVVPVDGQDPENGTVVVTVVLREDFFGEVALLKPDAKRTATVRALTYCDLFRLSVEDFSALFEKFAELSHQMEAEARNRGLMKTKEPRVSAFGEDQVTEGSASPPQSPRGQGGSLGQLPLRLMRVRDAEDEKIRVSPLSEEVETANTVQRMNSDMSGAPNCRESRSPAAPPPPMPKQGQRASVAARAAAQREASSGSLKAVESAGFDTARQEGADGKAVSKGAPPLPPRLLRKQQPVLRRGRGPKQKTLEAIPAATIDPQDAEAFSERLQLVQTRLRRRVEASARRTRIRTEEYMKRVTDRMLQLQALVTSSTEHMILASRYFISQGGQNVLAEVLKLDSAQPQTHPNEQWGLARTGSIFRPKPPARQGSMFQRAPTLSKDTSFRSRRDLTVLKRRAAPQQQQQQQHQLDAGVKVVGRWSSKEAWGNTLASGHDTAEGGSSTAKSTSTQRKSRRPSAMTSESLPPHPPNPPPRSFLHVGSVAESLGTVSTASAAATPRHGAQV